MNLERTTLLTVHDDAIDASELLRSHYDDDSDHSRSVCWLQEGAENPDGRGSGF